MPCSKVHFTTVGLISLEGLTSKLLGFVKNKDFFNGILCSELIQLTQNRLHQTKGPEQIKTLFQEYSVLVCYSCIRYQKCISRPHPKTKFSQNSLFPKENPQHLGLICKRKMQSAVTVVLCPWTNQSLAWHAHQRGHHATTMCTSSLAQMRKKSQVLRRSSCLG